MTFNSYRNPGSSQTINYTIDRDPTLPPGIPADDGALVARTDVPSIYYHSGPLDTDWTLIGSAEVPTPAFSTTTVKVIYARTTGNDTTGNGTLATPYATFARAIRDVPLVLPPLVRYFVDITGLDETLPVDFALPAIKGSDYYGIGSDHYGSRQFVCGLNIMSQLKEFSAITSAEAHIAASEITANVADAVTGLRLITTTKNYAAGVLRGAIFKCAGGRSAIVWDNTVGPNSAITLLTFSTNAVFNGPVILSEPGASLRADSFGDQSFSGVSFRHIDSFAVSGINLANTDADPFAYSANVVGSTTPIFSECYIEGIYIGPSTQYTYLAGCFLKNKTVESEGRTELLIAGSLCQDIPTFYTYDVESIQASGSGFRNCAAIGPRPTAFFIDGVPNFLGSGVPVAISIAACEIDGAVADSDTGTPGYGVFSVGPGLGIANTRISNCAADAIYVNGSEAVIQTVAGAANGGVGILADKGAQVSVRYPTGTADTFTKAGTTMTINVTSLPPADQGPFTQAMVGLPITISGSTTPANDGVFTVLSVSTDGKQLSYTNAAGVAEPFAGTWMAQTSSVTGTGDVKSGSLAAVTYAALALDQQYDLAPGPAGNPTTFNAQTGARIFRA